MGARPELDDDAEDAKEPTSPRGETTGLTSPDPPAVGDGGSSSTAISSSSASSSGSGRCSARKVSLFAKETPLALHEASTSSRLLVNSHWSTYCQTRFRGVVPVGASGCAPCSVNARAACCVEDNWFVMTE